nr:pyruvate, phosphate dikinase/phosphoenolpyruvate synthase regulator [candidate division Zixibacteria bacterium]
MYPPSIMRLMVGMDEEKKIVIVSDGTGKTAKRLMDAVLAQYDQHEVEYSIAGIYQEARDKKKINVILKNIENDYLVIYSIISENLSRYFHEKLSKRGILHLNVLRPMLKTVSKFLGVHPDYRPGILQIVDDRYYKKVDAIGYTVQHDDGGGPLITEADLVLVGLSRTCKTPISMYLACNHGLKVANIPIFPEDHVKEYLLDRLKVVNKEIIFGLIMHPEILAEVREERLQYLVRAESEHEKLKQYYDLHEIQKELKFCLKLYDEIGWQTIDVTRRAIEEISHEIMNKLGFSEEEYSHDII